MLFSSSEQLETAAGRVSVDGKFLRRGESKWYVKGFCYGPFAPNLDGDPLPEPSRLRQDFAHLQCMGANCIRIYFPPPIWLLDEALAHDLHVLIDVPWEKHRCFFEDWDALQRARTNVRHTARTLGNHPAVFAISVVNEIPVDVVRFYGHRRVEGFVDELMGIVKQEAPECLTTFANFPTTEFLAPQAADFCCFNVYLHDHEKLGTYLDRLQHIAGDKPLLIGEYGVDTIRKGEVEQAQRLAQHAECVFRHGLVGSLVFAYTDDWFTGGHQVEDWAFGVTDRNRTEKLAATELQQIWKKLPHSDATDLPPVSIVVCSYNGASTLSDCLSSLMQLDYPDFEVILVDDGSTDKTTEIAEQFPQVIYHRQKNEGLSVARNVGAQLASGEIVAYTDSDCIVDEHWLRYLVQSMIKQNVEAIGGPNISPNTDGWVAKCVAASPGNPSHVMLDDRCAEHVPGCNMAFRIQTLTGLGGFDPQFRQAGDDVDMCWRFLDAGYSIGYAPAAVVWHQRRATVWAFAQQQKGYGRSEAMVHFKHPKRFGPFGRSSWKGIIYDGGAVQFSLMPEMIYHGRFGSGLFQTIYRQNNYGTWASLLSLEWHLLAGFLLAMSTLFWQLAFISLAMWSATLALAIRLAANAPLSKGAPWWCRPLISYLYILQPILRGWYRTTHLLRHKRMPSVQLEVENHPISLKRISSNQYDLYWHSNQNLGREKLLDELVELAKSDGWKGDFDNAWADWDVKLAGDRWHNITVHSATEELGWPNRFTRARCTAYQTRFNKVILFAFLLWSIASLSSLQVWPMVLGLSIGVWILFNIRLSRRRCLAAATQLVARAGRGCGLIPVDARESMPSEPDSPNVSISPSPTLSQRKHLELSSPVTSNWHSDSEHIQS